jgi:Tol biopolymer transport system component
VRIVGEHNWEIFLGDMHGGDPVQLTYYDGWDGLPSVSPDGTKMAFTRSAGRGQSFYTYIMDISSLNVGPSG